MVHAWEVPDAWRWHGKLRAIRRPALTKAEATVGEAIIPHAGLKDAGRRS